MKNINKFYIKVSNKQVIDGETGVVEETADGSYDRRNGKVYIRYKTFEESAETSTTIIAGDDTVTIKRGGIIFSVMVYKRGQKTNFVYRMPYGAVNMEIYTEKLAAAFDENGGTIKICYTLSAQGAKYSNNTTIRVIRRGETHEF